jgi:hypothetical protein
VVQCPYRKATSQAKNQNHTTHHIMQIIDIENSKSYAREANLEIGTAKIDAMFRKAEDTNQITAHGAVRKMVVRNRAGRYTAVYILSGEAMPYVCAVASEGFMTIG